MWAPDAAKPGSSPYEDDPIPADLWAVFIYAREQGCAYVLFDADAEEVEGLQTYEG
jgi:hypothetical protein